ncbi:site-specific integrase [Thalassotalea ponticola]|uniref:tyrosine-type recombinase/integrase n=1 Tax=Thalassotalea ponticola TaxID=1523392 RepID=UPI0025B48C40|nr:site-specific integrase [Thalassotalea ponticola]MDN3651500.1 site-specific integrase [Thalassotalea ponticola]
MNIFLLITNITNLLKQASLPTASFDASLLNSLQLQKSEKNNPKVINERLNSFINSRTPMLEFKVMSEKGVYIRLYRKSIEFKDGQVDILAPEGVAVYHRGRYPGEKNARYELIGYLSKSLADKLITHINAYNQLTLKCKGIDAFNKIPTLAEFLPTYANILYMRNSQTVNKKIDLIKSKFPHLMGYPMDEIKGKQLIDFVNTYKRKRTATQIQNNESPYTVEESTIKDWVCTLRGALKAAASYTGLFKCCDSLWDKALKFKIDNESDKYLTDTEIQILIQSLKQRDERKLKDNQQNCQFSDYLAPLVLLCLSTGLRPVYALALKWSDIDKENMNIRIRATKGKIKETQYLPLSDEALALLSEWKKHSVHTQSTGNWLFPSPVKNGCHIVSYKNALTSFKKQYNLDFVLYDTRHTFATLVTKIYKNIQTTQALLLQKDAKSTKRYARVLETSKASAANDYVAQYPVFSLYTGESKMLPI